MLCKETGICVVGVIAVYDFAVLSSTEPLSVLSKLTSAMALGGGAPGGGGKKKGGGGGGGGNGKGKQGPSWFYRLPAWIGPLLLRQLVLWGSTAGMMMARFTMNRDDVVEVQY